MLAKQECGEERNISSATWAHFTMIVLTTSGDRHSGALVSTNIYYFCQMLCFLTGYNVIRYAGNIVWCYVIRALLRFLNPNTQITL
jgi:hypothetical protein